MLTFFLWMSVVRAQKNSITIQAMLISTRKNIFQNIKQDVRRTVNRIILVYMLSTNGQIPSVLKHIHQKSPCTI